MTRCGGLDTKAGDHRKRVLMNICLVKEWIHTGNDIYDLEKMTGNCVQNILDRVGPICKMSFCEVINL